MKKLIISGTYVNDLFTDAGGISEFAADFISVKLGYGPIAGKPIYVAGIFDYVFHDMSIFEKYTYRRKILSPGG